MKPESGIHTAVDCFAGCGGLTQGLKTANYQVLGAIEFDSAACRTYAINHPEVHVIESDISEVRGRRLMRQLGLHKGDLDLLAGCPPCQGFSTLRTMNGGRRVRDKQNDLVFELVRLTREMRPRWVMVENVPGLGDDRRIDDVMCSLSELGYDVLWDVFDVADYGVPQRRKRLVLLASRVCEVNFAKPRSKRRTVRDAIGGLAPAGRSGDLLHDMPEKRSAIVKERIRKIPPNGGSRSQLPARLHLKCHTKSDGFKDVYGRLAWDSQAATITTGCFNPSKGRFLHPVLDRAITMREAALLQTFPRNYRFPTDLGKVCIARLIGNALPPRFIAWHAQQISKMESHQIANANA